MFLQCKNTALKKQLQTKAMLSNYTIVITFWVIVWVDCFSGSVFSRVGFQSSNTHSHCHVTSCYRVLGEDLTIFLDSLVTNFQIWMGWGNHFYIFSSILDFESVSKIIYWKKSLYGGQNWTNLRTGDTSNLTHPEIGSNNF